MSAEDFRHRYLYISKNSLQFLKEKGFNKKGMNYSKENGEIILEIYSEVPRGWLNSEGRYEFQISWELMTNNKRFTELYMFMEGEKNIKKSPLLNGVILPDTYEGGMLCLKSEDPPGQDDKLIAGVKNAIEAELLPWFNHLNSIDDIIQIAEAESKVKPEERKLFRHTNIYRDISNLYAAQGWKDKTLEMCEKYIETTPLTARSLAEKRKNKYIKYFEKV